MFRLHDPEAERPQKTFRGILKSRAQQMNHTVDV